MVTVQITQSFDAVQVSLPEIEKLVKAVCKRFNLPDAAVSIAIVDDKEITELNKKFLNRDSVTDCLSFDLSNEDDLPKSFELVVNAQKAVKEAKLRGHSDKAELALYITHGLLHNLGFDDTSPEQAKKMHDTEDEILKQQGFGLVYNREIKQ